MAGSYPTGVFPANVAIADIDGDHHQDVVVSNMFGHTVSVFRNHGDGTLEPNIDFPGGIGADGLTIGDFDRNGRADIGVGGDPYYTDVLINICLR